MHVRHYSRGMLVNQAANVGGCVAVVAISAHVIRPQSVHNDQDEVCVMAECGSIGHTSSVFETVEAAGGDRVHSVTLEVEVARVGGQGQADRFAGLSPGAHG